MINTALCDRWIKDCEQIIERCQNIIEENRSHIQKKKDRLRSEIAAGEEVDDEQRAFQILGGRKKRKLLEAMLDLLEGARKDELVLFTEKFKKRIRHGSSYGHDRDTITVVRYYLFELHGTDPKFDLEEVSVNLDLKLPGVKYQEGNVIKCSTPPELRRSTTSPTNRFTLKSPYRATCRICIGDKAVKERLINSDPHGERVYRELVSKLDLEIKTHS